MKRMYSALAGFVVLSGLLVGLVGHSCVAHADQTSREFNACNSISNADDHEDCIQAAWDKAGKRFNERWQAEHSPQPKQAPAAPRASARYL